MTKLTLRTAIGSYGHTMPLKDGTVAAAMFEPEHIEVSPVTAIFRRMVRELEFDVAEMALSTYLCARAHGKAFTALPIFLTRAFYHAGIAVHRRSGIASPKDLEGRRVGVRSYTLTPGVWTRGILASEYGVNLDAITWTLSGDEHVAEFVAPPNVVSSPNDNLAEMLRSGEIDAAIGAGPAAASDPDIAPLFAEAEAEERDAAWSRQTGIYPISHIVVARDELLASHPGLAEALFGAFGEAKAHYLKRLASGAADGPGDRGLLKMAAVAGADDPIPYGLAGSRATLEAFVAYNLAQGVIPRGVEPEELFAAETLGLG